MRGEGESKSNTGSGRVSCVRVWLADPVLCSGRCRGGRLRLLSRRLPEPPVDGGGESGERETATDHGLRAGVARKNRTREETTRYRVPDVVFRTVLPVSVTEHKLVRGTLTASIQHSVPEYRAPTLAKPLPEVHMLRPISLNMCFAWPFMPWSRSSCDARDIGSSIAKDADIIAKNPPSRKPKSQLCHGAPDGYTERLHVLRCGTRPPLLRPQQRQTQTRRTSVTIEEHDRQTNDPHSQT